jgi:hypothetical protein
MLLHYPRYRSIPAWRYSESAYWEVGKLEEVQKARVETLCVGDEVARQAVAALKR